MDDVWWNDHAELARVYRWLADHDQLPDDEVGYFLEKPWKWTEERQAMLDAEGP